MSEDDPYLSISVIASYVLEVLLRNSALKSREKPMKSTIGMGAVVGVILGKVMKKRFIPVPSAVVIFSCATVHGLQAVCLDVNVRQLKY